ncbi:hypothetical protein AB0K57_02955 [Streptomyces halstedii]|uniref:hypothetical protein n=1 Tax=Streptomyces halstedii TaxID=1944 RepID=UPI00345FE8BE
MDEQFLSPPHTLTCTDPTIGSGSARRARPCGPAPVIPLLVFLAGPFIEEAAQDDIDVPVIAKCLAAWFPVS